MIADTKTQNIILVATLILGIVSGMGIASSSSYFNASYGLVSNLEVDLLEVGIIDLDPTNESVDPRITLVFNINAPTGSAGDASLIFLRAWVTLNEAEFVYTQTQWRKNIPFANQSLYPGYDMNFTMSETIYTLSDKQILYDADDSDEWTFSIRLAIVYTVFGAESNRYITFTYQGYA